MPSRVRLTRILPGRTAAVTLAGAATALLGAGTAAAATIAPASHVKPVVKAHATGFTANRAATAAPRAAAPRPAAPRPAAPRPAAPRAQPQAAPTWSQIQQIVARQTSPGEPTAADSLTPVGTSGPQSWMPISSAQQANATTIVQQALAKGMGLRSAVIAVATSMQESQLQNISHGGLDSLGLFQQRPSAGWGTPQQIMNPQYASDAFLAALQGHQAGDPGWATQPLWANAQAVQNSGVPFAYAQWESQAARLVQQIVTQLT